MKLRCIFTTLALVGTFILNADIIRWLSTEYNFGSFNEEAGKRDGKVQFINIGKTPTFINRVKSTCGCTVAKYSDAEIAPGDTATVSFTYNPAGRPGRFEKHIKVYTGEDNQLTTITIKGIVIGSTASLLQQYPIQSGPVRLSSDTLRLGEVTYGKARHEFLYGYNQSGDTLNLSWAPSPKALSLGLSSKKIAPGDLFTMSVYLNTRDEVAPGIISYPITLTSSSGQRIPLIVTANIKPDTQALTADQLRRSAKATVSPTTIDLGQLKTSAKPIKLNIKISNTGESTLEILRLQADNQAVEINTMPTKIKKGKSAEAILTLKPENLTAGNFRILLTAYTSDPLHPASHVNIIGTKQ